MKRVLAALAIFGLLSGCAKEKPEGGEAQASEAASSTPAPMPTASASAETGRVSQYSSLDSCRLIEEAKPGEGDYSVHACRGLGGYALKLSQDDLRENLYVIPPGGGEHSLALSEATGSGGFSRVGQTVEWRGENEGGAFRPDAMILRYFVVENAVNPEKETSYLLTVSLAGSKPCVTGKVAPGPEQNERAREATDARGQCL